MSEELQQPKPKPKLIRGANGAHSPQRLASMKRNWMIFRIRGLAKQADRIWEDVAEDDTVNMIERTRIYNIKHELLRLCNYYDILRQENKEIRELEKL